MATLIHAFKEWSVAVETLARGETLLLLRKGGIRESGGHFSVAHDQVLLYPTYEHQTPDLLKPAYRDQVQPVASGWHPEQVTIQAWAHITHIFQVTQGNAIAALLPYHIWNERFVIDRLKWKAQQPLYVLLLRVYRLPQAVQIPYQEGYGGCRSWIDLAEPIDLEGSTPALADVVYDAAVEHLKGAIAPLTRC
jgi:hypothetical protein